MCDLVEEMGTFIKEHDVYIYVSNLKEKLGKLAILT